MPPPIMGNRGGNHHGMPVSKARNVSGTLRRIWSYVAKSPRLLTLICLLVVVSTYTTVLGTSLIGQAIDKYIITFDFAGLAQFSVWVIAIFAVSAAATWLQMRLVVSVAQNTIRDIRQDLFYKLHTLPIVYFDRHTHGELMSRLANDVDNVGQTLNQSLIQFVSSILTVLMTVTAMLLISPVLTIIALLILPASIFVTKSIAQFSRRYFSLQQRGLGDLNGLIEETISGQRVVKVFGRERIVIDEFVKKNNALKDAGFKAQFFSGIIYPLMNSLNNLGFALIAVTGGWLAVTGYAGLTIGKISNMLIFSRQLSQPIVEISNLYGTLQSAIAGAERVFEVIDEPAELSDGKLVDKSTLRGNVEFQNVTFAYKKGENVLENVSISAKQGSTVALVGPTGAGKTTIVNLLTRFYDVDEGAITLDGEDIRTLDRRTLRQNLGMVLQDTYLFSASIRENIRYGRLNATDEEVEQAAMLANVHRFISHLPNGYDTVLADGGEGISQGQRQLIAIARVMLADPSVLILDEATSSIDTRTEKHIQQALLTLMNGRTSFVIAHRLSTIRDADEILVINHGRIIERGNHDTLYAQKGFYYNLYTSQFKRVAG